MELIKNYTEVIETNLFIQTTLTTKKYSETDQVCLGKIIKQ